MMAALHSWARPRQWTKWQAHLAGFGLLCLAIFTLFFGDFADMVDIWWNSSTYNHCLLMLPMIGWLISLRLPQLRTLNPTAWWPGVAALAGSGLVWLVGDAAGVALFRQLGVILMLQSSLLALLGPQVARALLFPLAYGLLLIPFGEEMVPLLQTVTARLSMVLLGVSGIPAHIEGVFITTPGGFFEVAEACSGVKFLIAMLAYSVFAAHLCFRSWRRRFVFVGLALVATVIANALRAYATIAVAQWRGVESASGFDHVFYGWIFFGLVLLAVMLVAKRWFDRPANDEAIDVSELAVPARRIAPWPVAAAAGLTVMLAYSMWSNVAGARAGALPASLTLNAPSGWQLIDAPVLAWQPRFDGADQMVVRHFSNDHGQRVDVGVAAYARQDEGREIVGYGQGAVDPDSKWTWSAALPPLAGGKAERLFHPGPVQRDAATWYWVDGQITGDPRTVKLLGLKARLLGGDPRALALVVSSEVDAGGLDGVAAFVADAGGAKALADQSLKLR